MARKQVRSRRSAASVRGALRSLPGRISNANTAIGRSFRARLAHAVATELWRRFRILSRGGSADGVRWPPLADSTCRQRRGRGLSCNALSGGAVERSMVVGRLTESSTGARYTPPRQQLVADTARGITIQNMTTYGEHNPRTRELIPAQIPAKWWPRIMQAVNAGLLRDIARGLR